MVDIEHASYQELDEKIIQLFAVDSFDFSSNNTNDFTEHFTVKDLSKEQCEFFDDNGYLIVNNAISAGFAKFWPMKLLNWQKLGQIMARLIFTALEEAEDISPNK